MLKVFRNIIPHCCTLTCKMSSLSKSNPSLVLQILASSSKFAHQAGKIIREVLSKGDLGIVEKGARDLQTEADRKSESCIIANLKKQYPDITVIGEEATGNVDVPSDWLTSEQDEEILSQTCPESLLNVTSQQVVVWVDPLDGTAEFTQGFLDHVTVLIGIAVGSEAVAGIIYQPYYNYQTPGATLGRIVWGVKELGVGGLTTSPPEEGKNIITTTRSHSNKEVKATLEALKPDNVLHVGGAGHKVLLVLEGKAHAYVFASPGCKKWDTCAPEAVLHALGGQLTDIHGNGIQYHRDVKFPNTGGVLATSKEVSHDWYLKRIPQEVKDILIP